MSYLPQCHNGCLCILRVTMNAYSILHCVLLTQLHQGALNVCTFNRWTQKPRLATNSGGSGWWMQYAKASTFFHIWGEDPTFERRDWFWGDANPVLLLQKAKQNKTKLNKPKTNKTHTHKTSDVPSFSVFFHWNDFFPSSLSLEVRIRSQFFDFAWSSLITWGSVNGGKSCWLEVLRILSAILKEHFLHSNQCNKSGWRQKCKK